MTRAQSVHYGSLRAGDADRERALDALRTAYGDGRLDDDEFRRRTDQVLRALTFAELERVTIDIPGGAEVVRFRPGGRVSPKPSRRAVACITLGFAGWLGPNLFAWIPAVVLGHRARRELRRDGGAGHDLTTIGPAVAYVGLAFEIIAVAVLIAVLGRA